MKKLILASIAAAGLLSASYTFAGNSLSDYYSSLHPSNKAIPENFKLHPPTDITVINASTRGIYAVIPNSPVNDYINPGYNDHIYNYNPDILYTFLVLQDPYRSTFHSAMVCRLAILTVYGTPGSYRIYTDNDLCN